LPDPPKFTQIRIFGFKLYHLATLLLTLPVTKATGSSLCPDLIWTPEVFILMHERLEETATRLTPGLPDGFFKTKNHNLVKFSRALEWESLVFSLAIWNKCVMVNWNILRSFW
jgi:hypothetical protein